MFRLAVAVLTAAAGFIVSLDSSSLASKDWWKPSDDLVFLSIVAVAFSVLAQFIDAEIERRRVKRRTELANEISKLMFPVWYKVRTVAKDRATQERMGVHVWMVPTWHWNFVPERLRSLTPESWRSAIPTPRMWRACNYRLKVDQHDGTDIRWTRDVGAIGRCWRERRRQHIVLNDDWGDTVMSKADWNALPSSKKHGLRYEQYVRVHQKYHSVLVLPIYKEPDVPGSRFIGCVVVDALATHPVDLNRRGIQEKAYKAARSVALRVVPIAS